MNPSGNSILLRPAKPMIVSLRESANSPDALRRSSRTPLIDSIPACIASRTAFIRSAAFKASSAALAPSSTFDASLYFFCSSARMSPKPRPCLRLSLILSMKLPMPSPTAPAKSVLSANSIIVADRPIRNSPASSAFCANPSIKSPTVRAMSKSFTSCIASIKVPKALDAIFAPETITSIIFAPLSWLPNSCTLTAKFFNVFSVFLKPFSTASPTVDMPLTMLVVPLRIPSNIVEPRPTMPEAKLVITFLVAFNPSFNLLSTIGPSPGILPNKLIRPRTHPVILSKAQPRNLPIPSAILFNTPKMPSPTFPIAESIFKNMFLTPPNKSLKAPTKSAIAPITKAKTLTMPSTTKEITLIIALKIVLTTS